MSRYDPILTVVPAGAQVTPALRRAAQLARAGAGTLHLCIFEYDDAVDFAAARAGGAIAGHARNDLVREQQEKLGELASGDLLRGLAVQCDVVWAPLAHEAVIAKALATGAQLVVKDSHRESLLRRTVFTPLDWKLMRLLPCSTLFVQAGEHPRPQRIAAAVDVLAEPAQADGLNARILHEALGLAECLEAQLEVVSVVPFLAPHRHTFSPVGRMFEEAEAAHLAAFTEFMDFREVPPECRHRLAGAPAAVLAEFVANRGIGLLVLGSAYRDAWDRLLLGSTAETLMQEAAVDLMLVKPAGTLELVQEKFDLAQLCRRHERLQEGLPAFPPRRAQA
ncbi:MAG: universal stress protein [Nevskia sp.]|nr:universal stress protein [Nevskia sp.]